MTREKKIEMIKDHVTPEFEIFQECYKKISEERFKNEPKNKKDRDEKRIFFDCFLLCTRKLREFFLGPKKNRYDFFADDLLNEEKQKISWDLLSAIPISKINKQLAHISSSRITGAQEDLFPKKNEIYNAVKKALEDYNEKVVSDFKINIKL